MIDTLKIAKRLQKQGLSQPASEELSEILNEFAESNLASKQDIEEVKRDIEEVKKEIALGMANTKADLLKWIIGLSIAQIGMIVTLVKLL